MSTVAVLGAGPIGLEAALAAADYGHRAVVYERAPFAGGNVRDWGHVRMFTPWSMNVSPRARRALGRSVPDGDGYPSGAEYADRLLEPLAALPTVAPALRLDTRVVAVAREGLLKDEEIGNDVRAGRPFRILVEHASGERVERADVVLDCTGGYDRPLPLGDGGIPALGERALGDRIRRRVPDLVAEPDWTTGLTLLVGAGASAQTAARDLSAAGARVVWAVRDLEPTWGAVPDDPLPLRVELTGVARHAMAGQMPGVELRRGVVVRRLAEAPDGRIEVELADGSLLAVDRVLGLTGSVGDHTIYRALQVHECYATDAPINLSAALLGAAGGDCLAQTSHGVDVLRNPEPGFFILGAKSYGRNSTFLARVGWDQVDEVFAALATDAAA